MMLSEPCATAEGLGTLTIIVSILFSAAAIWITLLTMAVIELERKLDSLSRKEEEDEQR